MKRKQLEELGLDEEQVNAVMKAYGESINDIKDKAEKVDGLESQIEDYKKQIGERDNQLKELEGKAQGNEELQKQIQDLQKANEDTQKEWETKLNQQAFDFALDKAITGEQARNPKAVRALLDTESIQYKDGKLIGLDEQLKGLKESDAYLFGEEQPAGLAGRQPVPGDDSSKPKGPSDLQKRYQEAMESGDTPLAVSLKNQIHQQTLNGE